MAMHELLVAHPDMEDHPERDPTSLRAEPSWGRRQRRPHDGLRANRR